MYRLLLMVVEKYSFYFAEHKKKTTKAPASKALCDKSSAEKDGAEGSGGVTGHGAMAWKVMTSTQTSKLIQLGISALR